MYSISESPSTANLTPMTVQSQQQLNEAYEARQTGEWDHALSVLRQCQEYISPDLVSYLRGSIWLEAGNPDVATEFYRHALEFDSTNANYTAIYLYSLSKSDPKAAAMFTKEVLADPEKYAPVVVARAADIYFRETRVAPEAMNDRVYRELIPVLKRNLARLEADDSVSSRSSTYAMTVGLLGFCHEFLGNAQAAVQHYTLGLRLDSKNDGLLVARGILQYGGGPQAITDLELAAKLGSPVVWPYFFLAHHYLTTGRFEQCRAMCETGLRMRGSNTAMSQLEEWQAIAQAELGFPANLVMASFEKAILLDPSNETAKRNGEAFEKWLSRGCATPPTHWEQKTSAAVRLFGLAERRYDLVA
jgi:tetratricopeptide (TPR) repeat protein